MLSKIFMSALPYLVIVALAGVLYIYITGLQDDVKTLTKNNAVLEFSVKAQGDTIDAQAKNIDRWSQSQADMQEHIEEMAKIAISSQKESRRLQNVFAKHKFGELAKKKPTLVERRINSGTDRINRLLLCQTSKDNNCTDKAR